MLPVVLLLGLIGAAFGAFECGQEGVLCNADGDVIELNLTPEIVTRLRWTDIAPLTYLKSLYVTDVFVGYLSPVICTLDNLQYLWMEHAVIIGRIPECMCNMTNLMYITMPENFLFGHIPQCLGDMTHLKGLDLSYNLLFGDVPAGLADLEWLTTVELQCNLALHCDTYVPQEGVYYLCDDDPGFAGCPLRDPPEETGTEAEEEVEAEEEATEEEPMEEAEGETEEETEEETIA